MSKLRVRFGIPSLDQLFSSPDAKSAHWGIKIPSGSDHPATTSVCIAGPSGTGKSVLAMHLAARYYADCAALSPWGTGFRPTVIHVSTDLSSAQAREIWQSFALHWPNERNAAFPSEKVKPLQPLDGPLHLDLRPCCFASDADFEALARMMDAPCNQTLPVEVSLPNGATGTPRCGEVIFLNLAESTAGDDWNFVIKLLSLLRRPAAGSPCHLLIIDAVEGMEMALGQRDAFGEVRSRRSRIAQVLRHATRKCHVVLVREEKNPQNEMPEEFVTDAVLRLRSELDGQYLRRTLEVVKSRGQSSVRGQHHYIIRGATERPDDPETRPVPAADDPPVTRPDQTDQPQAYIHVCPSLHCLSRLAFRPSTQTTRSIYYAGFEQPQLPGILPENSLPGGKVTVLTGDEATTKSRFARAFLAGAFQPPRTNPPGAGDAAILQGGCAAVLITTSNLTRTEIIERLKLHGAEATTNWDNCFIHRQLEVHDLSSAVLLHIIRRSIDKALNNLGEDPDARGWADPATHARKVRVVIDDWSIIQAGYPAVAKDELFLQFVVRYLERVGVTTLIVETQPGRPGDVFGSDSPRHLRSLASHHLFTWHVPFYGEDKVAITAVPPLRADLSSLVVELRAPLNRGPGADELLEADPHFELYLGLETGNPVPVPLSVQLFAAAEGFGRYAKLTNDVLNRVFVPKDTGAGVVVALPPSDYPSLRDFAFLHSGARANYTVVLTVDEYWPANEFSPSVAARPYLAQITHDRRRVCRENDPYEAFQPELASQEPRTKSSFFPLAHVYGRDDGFPQSSKTWPGDDKWSSCYDNAGLVPYLWDFGFVMLDEAAWQAAVKSDSTGAIKGAWEYCTGRSKVPHLSWLQFLEACAGVAAAQPAGSAMGIFKPEALTAQSFACLVLEIWFSEIGADKLTGPGKPFSETRLPNNTSRRGRSLNGLLEKYRLQFVKTWLLLSEVIDTTNVFDEHGHLRSAKTTGRVAAERHWYSTATCLTTGGEENRVLHPCRLPGQYVTRGDWFLSIGRESRSPRLGERVIDFLSRRRANLTRLECGLGLPVRDILLDQDTRHFDEMAKKLRYQNIETALLTTEDGSVRRMSYQQVRELGVPYPWVEDSAPSEVSNRRHWLWRSQITDYHRHDRIFERWIERLLVATVPWRRELHLAYSDGFAEHKSMTEDRLKSPRYQPFREMLDVMGEDLEKLASKL